jgi:nucleoid DNA-binding protein
MNNPIEEKIVMEIAKELGISPNLVQKIVKSQFEFVKVTMEKGEFETIKLPYFGKWHVKPYRLQKVNENYGTFYHRRKSSNNLPGTETSPSIQEDNQSGQGPIQEASSD